MLDGKAVVDRAALQALRAELSAAGALIGAGLQRANARGELTVRARTSAAAEDIGHVACAVRVQLTVDNARRPGGEAGAVFDALPGRPAAVEREQVRPAIVVDRDALIGLCRAGATLRARDQCELRPMLWRKTIFAATAAR